MARVACRPLSWSPGTPVADPRKSACLGVSGGNGRFSEDICSLLVVSCGWGTPRQRQVSGSSEAVEECTEIHLFLQ